MTGKTFYLELFKRLEREEAVTVSTFLEGKNKGSRVFGEAKEEEGLVFRETFYRRPHVVLLGGGHVSLALERVLKTLELDLTVVDDRQEFASRERFQEADQVICYDFSNLSELDFGKGAYYIIVTRGHSHDEICLKEILRRSYTYVGMIGSQKKVAACLEHLLKEGVDPAALQNIHAPIGLKIGGSTPGEIAVSIAAELIQVKNQKERQVFPEEVKEGILSLKGFAILASVISKSGSSPGKKGSRMLILEDGTTIGTIGGGAVEYQVIKEARNRLGEDVFISREYALSNEGAASLGMVCGGKMTVLLESLSFEQKGESER